MTDEARASEAERVRAAYARRAELGLDSPLRLLGARQPLHLPVPRAALLSALQSGHYAAADAARVLDAGCGDGGVLRELLRYGAEGYRPEWH